MSAAKTRYWKKLGKHWTRGRILTQMRQRRQRGLCLRKSRIPQDLYGAASLLFGSWKAAVETLGLDYDDVTGARRWTRPKLIAAIQKLHDDGVDLGPSQIERHRPAIYAQAMKFFPHSWANALRAARINPREYMTPRIHWSREIAADWVQTRNAKGHSILVRDAPEGMQRFLRLLRYSDFVETLGITYPGIKQRHDWSRKAVLTEIRA